MRTSTLEIVILLGLGALAAEDSTLGTHDGVLILDGGTLTTEFADDLVQANVWNTDGASITWTGSAYHNFTITGDYTLATSSTPQGALDMRIQYTTVAINDTLTVNGDMDYVTVDVNVVGNLPGDGGGDVAWQLITANEIDDNEITVNFPSPPTGRAWDYAVTAVGADEVLTITLLD